MFLPQILIIQKRDLRISNHTEDVLEIPKHECNFLIPFFFLNRSLQFVVCTSVLSLYLYFHAIIIYCFGKSAVICRGGIIKNGALTYQLSELGYGCVADFWKNVRVLDEL